jgi:hypothetical protein
MTTHPFVCMGKGIDQSIMGVHPNLDEPEPNKNQFNILSFYVKNMTGRMLIGQDARPTFISA